MREKVFVGMSGGVDSSLAAALLAKRDFQVVGVFIKVWEPDSSLWKRECTSREDRLDAMRVATALGIEFRTVDLSKEYEKEVIKYMIDEYKKGRTPNPDVMCNRKIKFGAFLQYAVKEGVDCVATGHYARIKEGVLLKGADRNKDQSYFLWTLKENDLKRIIFPIGHLKKEKVRKMAKERGLFTADKKDSQGLCFIGQLDLKEFLKKKIKPREGAILNEKGEIIGKHNGAFFYTLGERHGFEIKKEHQSSRPFYVIAKEIKKNTITVSPEPLQSSGAVTEVKLEKTNWVSSKPIEGKKYQGMIRYRQTPQNLRLEVLPGNKARVIFEDKQIAPFGQSLVVYDEDKCLGGGIIY